LVKRGWQHWEKGNETLVLSLCLGSLAQFLLRTAITLFTCWEHLTDVSIYI